MHSDLATAILLEKIVQSAYSKEYVRDIPQLQWSILRCLQQMPPDQCEVLPIARYLDAPRPAIRRGLRRLSLHGFVKRANKEENKRVTKFTLTSSGVATLQHDPMLTVAGYIELLPPGERERFRRSVQSIGIRLFLDRGGLNEQTSTGGR